MPATPTTGSSGNSYATIAEADSYLDNSIRAGDTWLTVSSDDKARALISATRLLDKQCWVGDKTDESQTLDWPRTGVTDAEGNAVDDSIVPDGIISGCIELAYELSQDPTLETSQNTGSNDKRYKAGSVELEFWRPGGVLGTSGITRFPPVVMEFIREFMCGQGNSGTPEAFGTDHGSQFDDCDSYEFNGPLS